MGNPPQNQARVQKSDDGTINPLDSRPILPIIDGHCHIFGHSLYEGGDAVDAAATKSPVVGLGVGKGTRRFLAYTISRDFDNGAKVLQGIPHEKGVNALNSTKWSVAAVPLLLDMGFTPLDMSMPGGALPRAQSKLTERQQIDRTNRARTEPSLTGKRVLSLSSLQCRKSEDVTGDDDIRIEVYDGATLLKVLPALKFDMDGVTRMINEDIVFDATASDIRIRLYEEDSTDSDDLLGSRLVDLKDSAAEQWKKAEFGNSDTLRSRNMGSSQARKGTHYELTYKVSKKDSGSSESSSGSTSKKRVLTIEYISCKDQEDWSGSDKIRTVVSPAPPEPIKDFKIKVGETVGINSQIVFEETVTVQLLEVDADKNDALGSITIDTSIVQRATQTIKYNSTLGDAEYVVTYTVEPGTEDPADDEFYGSSNEYLWFRRDSKVYRGTIDMLSRVAARYPAEIWPLVPFDPRRQDGLDFVKRAIEEQGFVGVKLYSRCGWMPYENREIYGDKLGGTLDKRLDAFYDYLIENDLPVLNHTSPTGFPPDGQLVYPRGYGSRASPGPTKSFKKPGMVPMWHTVPGGANPTYLQGVRDKIHRVAISFGKYCHYVQKTTSPYAWAPVLGGKWGKLRLCLAHSGSDIAIYHRFRKTIDSAIAADGDLKDAFENSELFESRIRENPFVLPGSEFRSYFEAKLFHECKGMCFGSIQDGTHVEVTDDETRSEIKTYLDSTPWKQWFEDWESAYPGSWLEQILKYEKNNENVFSDISYISGDSAPVFQKLVEVIVSDAGYGKGADGGPDGKIMADKHFVGTDWYMTEISEMGPSDFWARIKKGFEQSLKAQENKKGPWTMHPIFANWVTKNCLTWLNIAPRLKGNGFKVLDDFYKKNSRSPEADKPLSPPGWWKSIESFYECK